MKNSWRLEQLRSSAESHVALRIYVLRCLKQICLPLNRARLLFTLLSVKYRVWTFLLPVLVRRVGGLSFIAAALNRAWRGHKMTLVSSKMKTYAGRCGGHLCENRTFTQHWTQSALRVCLVGRKIWCDKVVTLHLRLTSYSMFSFKSAETLPLHLPLWLNWTDEKLGFLYLMYASESRQILFLNTGKINK